jgi:hypothetical protein
MERTDAAGLPSEIPPDYVAIHLPDGVVLDRRFVERTAPGALHSQEELEEDDSFLSVGNETWDYDVARGRDDDFLAALQKSQMVMECVPLEDDRSPAA